MDVLVHANRFLAVLGVATGLSACAGLMQRSSELPQAPVSGVLEIATPDVRPAAFSVVAISPKGKVTQVGDGGDDAARALEVAITFNRAMAPLAPAGENLPDVATVRVHDGVEVAGVWRWVGTRTAVFAPRPRLLFGTHYDIEFKSRVASLAGEVLSTPQSYGAAFSTAPVSVVSAEPIGHSRDLDGTALQAHAKIRVLYSQRVTLADAAKYASLSNRSELLQVRAERDAEAPKDERRVVFVPARPFAENTSVTLIVDGAMRGAEGTLPSGVAFKKDWHTAPAFSAELECGQRKGAATRACDPASFVSVELNALAKPAQLKAALRLDGKAIAWTNDYNVGGRRNGLTRAVRLPLVPKPGVPHTLSVVGPLSEVRGRAYKGPRSITFHTRDYSPKIRVGGDSGVLEAERPATTRVLKLAAINLARYTVETAVLPEALQWRSDPAANDATWEESAPWVSRTVVPSAARNVFHVENIALDELLVKSRGRGVVAVRVKYTDADGKPVVSTTTHAVTDMALTGKTSVFGSEIHVTHLATARPYGDVGLALQSDTRTVWQGRCDATGKCVVPAVDPATCKEHHCAYVARSSDDIAVLGYEENQDGWSDPFASDHEGTVFSERGFYQPGETAHIKGVVRTLSPHGNKIVPGELFTLSAERQAFGDEAPFFKTELKSGPFGEFAVDVPLGKMQSLGPIRFQLDGHGLSTAAVVNLGAYRSAAFEVSVNATNPVATAGDALSFNVQAHYLSGGPMSGLSAHVVGYAHDAALPALAELADTLLLGDRVTWPATSNSKLTPRIDRSGVARGDEPFFDEARELDAAGALAVSLVAPPSDSGLPQTVTLEAEVADVTHQSGAGRATTMVHPTDVYVAIGLPSSGVAEAGKPIAAMLAAVEHDGTLRVGVSLRAELLRTEQVCNSKTDLARDTCHTTEARVAACEARTDTRPVPCVFPTHTEGSYVVRVQGADAHGRLLRGSQFVDVERERATAWGLGNEDPNGFTLKADKKEYKPGDTAKVQVHMPYPESDALVSVERVGVYRSYRTHFSARDATIEVPINEAMGAAVHVVVRLLRPRTGEGGADVVQAPWSRFASLVLPIDVASHRLQVSATGFARSYAPRAQVDADLTVLTASGRPAVSNVTVYAVDAGVLMLSGYKRPDLLETFVSSTDSMVANADSRSHLAPLYDPNVARGWGTGSGMGNGQGGGGMHDALAGRGPNESMDLRKDFRTTAFYRADLVTDNAGRVHVSFALPDNLTTYRLMAVAVSKNDQYGGMEADLVVAKKLMARPAMPRYAHAGDEIRGGVVVTNQTGSDTTVRLKARAGGVTLLDAPDQQQRVPAGGQTEVLWRYRAVDVGTAMFQFDAVGETDSDSVEVALPVRAPLVPEAVAFYNETDTVVRESVGALHDVRSDFGSLEVQVAATPLVGLQAAFDLLQASGHETTESLATQMLAAVAALELQKQGVLVAPADAGAKLQALAARLLTHQMGERGFSRDTRDADEPDCYLSAYATYALWKAKSQVDAVSPDNIAKGIAHLRGRCLAASPKGQAEAAVPWSSAVFASDMLASMGETVDLPLEKLLAERTQMSAQDAALLAHAMTLAKNNAPAGAELRQAFVNALKPGADGTARVASDTNSWYGSAQTAHALRALVAAGSGEPMVVPTMKLLLAERAHGSWRSGPASAWALLSLSEAAASLKLGQNRPHAECFLGRTRAIDATLGAGLAGAATRVFPMKDVMASEAALGLTTRATGGRVYTASTLRYARKELPKIAIEAGMAVEARLAVLPKRGGDAPRGDPFPAYGTTTTRVQVGDVVAIDVDVTSDQDLDGATVVVAIPAGLEAVRTDVQTESKSSGRGRALGSNGDEPTSYDEHEVRWSRRLRAGLHHFRVLARATTRGSYVVPPMRAESMYNPDVFGRTAGGKLEVK